MLDLTTKRPKTHLSDLLRRSSSSEDIFGNYYEPINRAPLTFSCDDDGSGASTPPLWRQSSPPGSPDRSRRSALYSSLSPRSRTEAIARGQMELMEMVKNMPESCYELSLKDLVEINHNHRSIGGGSDDNNNLLGVGGAHAKTGAKRVGARGPLQPQQMMVRSGSLDNNNGGFLLKMVFPVSWGAKKKKRDYCANTSNSLRASPVPEKEWWKRRNSTPAANFAFASESGESSLNSGSRKSSSGSSSSSNNSGSRRYEDMNDCWSFIRTHRGKSLK